MAQAQQPHFTSLPSLDFARDKQIAGATISQTDPNHPVEVFYGSAAYNNIKEMISEAGITVYPEDKVEMVPPPAMGLGSQIIITRATPVQIIDAKKSSTYRTWQTTVGDLMTENNISLLGQDSVSPATSSTLSYAMKITITRVAEVEVQENQPIAFTVTKKTDNTLEKGNTKVTQKGINGEKVLTYKVKRVDGEEVSKTLEGTQISKAPQNEIDVVGTKVVVFGSGRASWYGRKQTLVAASNTLPKGTKVHVVAVNSGKSVDVTIDDTGIQTGAIIDLSSDAFKILAPLGAGIVNVRVEKYYP